MEPGEEANQEEGIRVIRLDETSVVTFVGSISICESSFEHQSQDSISDSEIITRQPRSTVLAPVDYFLELSHAESLVGL